MGADRQWTCYVKPKKGSVVQTISFSGVERPLRFTKLGWFDLDGNRVWMAPLFWRPVEVNGERGDRQA